MVPSSTHRLPLPRISLYYLFTYLTLTGLGLMFSIDAQGSAS